MTPVSATTTSSQEQVSLLDEDIPYPDLDELITEDGKPVDNIYIEKLYRLLTDPLYSSWAGPGEGRPFLALTDVGWFFKYKEPPLVPDALLSLDAEPAGDLLGSKAGRSYFQWLIGKPPEVVIEVISDLRGGEDTYKMRQYARLGVLYYVLYDPRNILQGGVLRAYVLSRGQYEPTEAGWLPEVGLGLTLWTGTFEGQHYPWLRWCDRDGRVIPTGAEKAEVAERKAEEAERKAEEQAMKTRDAEEKIARMKDQLRALGIDPEA